ncbi:alpha/beta fold hydrolase [Actinoalloteichus hymeniacidonis]|uniref:Hydrolase or acyltransferase of alpha/beta superfamily n=1 Tax=Actinoalloteichus hymeniacidonis TaxID=340345 RepID=A0AAC9HMC5_9PSEU|nr:alpha/beta hydrolase [Actinoalloteichus hymeniacidonis]AOS61987.1 putative hydrolase or acyltransferase of alpha/beta superfamily [Actinoalloteichus hymeniacidonis]MBB5909991.1 pimeloyl-ACP methyl ester carboxylesterase [Actinoalloteichus hymeniacidonis]
MLKILGAVFGAVIVGGGLGIGSYAWNNTTFANRERNAVKKAGYVERTHELPTGVRLNYAEGPANGPAVLLVHGQGVAWEDYAPVLPQLAQDFHVFAVDVVGHGSSSRTPGRYDVNAIGADIAAFIDDVIGKPVILSGHSSGGLIAAWVAANEPAHIAGVLFEDPPFFSTEPARMPQQFNYVDLASPAHEFLQQDTETDFASWYMEHNAWLRYFGNGRAGIARHARNYRTAHPDSPLSIWFFPPGVNRSFQFMHEFDPAFADAFYTCQWQGDFDQQATLEAVGVPSILVHANWRITDAGILEGAMTDDDASRACTALPNCRIERVNTGHGFHGEDPRTFVRLLRELRDSIGLRSRREYPGADGEDLALH